MSDDTPTQRFDVQPASAEPHEEARKSRLALILGIIGGVLLLVVILLLILLLRTQGTPLAAATDSPTPSASPSPSPGPAPAPTPTPTVIAPPPPPPPVDHNVTITGYSISPAQIDCSSTAPADAANLSISWHSLNGTTAYFGVNTGDAQSGGMGWMLPPNGTQHDFPTGYDPYPYQCGNATESFTITIVGNGHKVSKIITIHRKP
jgi:hypothetical protein